MEQTTYFILPYALDIDEKGHKRAFTREAETALLFVLAERERQRMLREGAVNITLVGKIFYSAWIAPRRDGTGLFIDSLGLFPQALHYGMLPDYEPFIAGVTKSTSVEEYLHVLRKYTITFFSMRGSKSFVISLVSQKGLVSDLQSYIVHCIRENVTGALSLNPRISWQEVLNFIKMLLESEADIEKLNSIRKDLIERTNQWVERQNEAIESIQKKYLTRIEEEKSEDRIEELHCEYKAKVTEVEKTMDEEMRSLGIEQEEVHAEIQHLHERRNEYTKILENMQRQKEVLTKHPSELQQRRDELSRELSKKRAMLEDLKMEQLRLEDLAEAQKGVTQELNVTRERLSQIVVEVNKLQSMVNVELELRQEDDKRDRLQESIANLSRQMADTAKVIRDLEVLLVEKRDRLVSIPHQIEDIRKIRHEEILRIDRDYRLEVDGIRERIDALHCEMTHRVRTERKRIGEMIMRTNDITSYIDGLAEAKSSFIHSLHDTTIFLPKSLAIKEPILLQIPLYLVCYEAPAERRYIFYSPITVKHTRRMLWSKKTSIETWLKNLDQIVKGKLDMMMKKDASFEEEVLNSCARLNLLRSRETPEVLLKGLSQLKFRRWISDAEASKVMTILSEYTHQQTDVHKEQSETILENPGQGIS